MMMKECCEHRHAYPAELMPDMAGHIYGKDPWSSLGDR